jgi:transcriptional regulator with XRE-family HTH domain
MALNGVSEQAKAQDNIAGRRLAMARKAKGYTWQQIADAVGAITANGAYTWTKKGRSVPPEHLPKLAALFKVDDRFFTTDRISDDEFLQA